MHSGYGCVDWCKTIARQIQALRITLCCQLVTVVVSSEPVPPLQASDIFCLTLLCGNIPVCMNEKVGQTRRTEEESRAEAQVGSAGVECEKVQNNCFTS